MPLTVGTSFAFDHVVRTYLYLLLVLPFGACMSRDTVTAVIQHNLPADGCSYPVTVAGVEYAPDAASLPGIRERTPIGTTTVQIEFHITGNVARVECGFGTFRDLPEASVEIVGR